MQRPEDAHIDIRSDREFNGQFSVVSAIERKVSNALKGVDHRHLSILIKILMACKYLNLFWFLSTDPIARSELYGQGPMTSRGLSLEELKKMKEITDLADPVQRRDLTVLALSITVAFFARR
jgi:hypothetical protein